MYKFNRPAKTTAQVDQSYKGERIEEKINRIVNNREPITDGAPIVYTERKDGVKPEYNIKTDRFEIAVDAMDKVSKAYIAKREENIKNFENKLNKKNQRLNDEGKGGADQGTTGGDTTA